MQLLRDLFSLPSAPLMARHQPSGLNSGFNGDGLSFADYVARNRAMLRDAHSKLGGNEPVRSEMGSGELEKIINGNAPFELTPSPGFKAGQHKPYKRGVLLTHGLTDSPYFMRHLAAFFQRSGFRVMAVLLPGHGTQPGDLLDARWQEWAKTVAYGTDQLSREADEVYLAGYSIGGTLSAYQSLPNSQVPNSQVHDSRVRGLFLFAPALQITPRAAFANLHKLYSGLIPSAKWLDIMPDRDIYKYESFAKNAAAQTYALTKNLGAQLVEHERVRLHDLGIPVFAVASVDDMTVDTSATVRFMAQARHPCSRLVLYTTDVKTPPPGMQADKLELVNSTFPEQRILSSSHLAIVLPAADAHYGLRGAYSNCIHYFQDDTDKYHACINHPEADLQGEITPKNLHSGILRRLMYNPNFAALEVSMQRFIDALPE